MQSTEATSAGKELEPAELASLERRKAHIISQVQRFTHKAFKELKAVSSRSVEELLESVHGMKLNEETIKSWERWVMIGIPMQEASAEKLFYQDFMEKLLDSYNRTPRAISMNSIKEWVERFKKDAEFDDRKKFIHQTLPNWITNWERVADQRHKLLKDPGTRHLKKNDVRDIEYFLNEEKFLNLKYADRQDLADRVDSALSGANVAELYSQAESILRPLEGKTIGNANRWLQRIFNDWKMSPSQIQRFVKQDLPNLKMEWREVRIDFDHVNAALKGAGPLPANFRMLNTAEFLSLHFSKRQEYVGKANDVLDKMLGTPPLMLAEIDELLRTNDVKAALGIIEDCEVRTPDDPHLAKRRRDAETALAKMPSKPQKSHKELNEDIWNCLEQTAEPIRSLNEDACREQDAEVLERILQTQFNRAWCRGRGFLDDEIEQKQASSEENENNTEEYIENGHTRQIERNIVRVGTDTHNAIKGDNCNRPQAVIADAHSSAVRTAFIRRAKEHKTEKYRGFGYWTTFIPITQDKQVQSYSHQRQAVFTINPKLRKSFRELVDSGGKYRPRSEKYAGTTVVPSSAAETSAGAAETHVVGKA